mgnify:CR=1 FL=1
MIRAFPGEVVLHRGRPYRFHSGRTYPEPQWVDLAHVYNSKHLCRRVHPDEVLARADLRDHLQRAMCARCGDHAPDHQPGTDERWYCADCCPDCREAP